MVDKENVNSMGILHGRPAQTTMKIQNSLFAGYGHGFTGRQVPYFGKAKAPQVQLPSEDVFQSYLEREFKGMFYTLPLAKASIESAPPVSTEDDAAIRFLHEYWA